MTIGTLLEGIAPEDVALLQRTMGELLQRKSPPASSTPVAPARRPSSTGAFQPSGRDLSARRPDTLPRKLQQPASPESQGLASGE